MGTKKREVEAMLPSQELKDAVRSFIEDSRAISDEEALKKKQQVKQAAVRGGNAKELYKLLQELSASTTDSAS